MFPKTLTLALFAIVCASLHLVHAQGAAEVSRRALTETHDNGDGTKTVTVTDQNKSGDNAAFAQSVVTAPSNSKVQTSAPSTTTNEKTDDKSKPKDGNADQGNGGSGNKGKDGGHDSGDGDQKGNHSKGNGSNNIGGNNNKGGKDKGHGKKTKKAHGTDKSPNHEDMAKASSDSKETQVTYAITQNVGDKNSTGQLGVSVGGMLQPFTTPIDSGCGVNWNSTSVGGGFNAVLPNGGLGGGWNRDHSGNLQIGFGYKSTLGMINLEARSEKNKEVIRIHSKHEPICKKVHIASNEEWFLTCYTEAK